MKYLRVLGALSMVVLLAIGDFGCSKATSKNKLDPQPLEAAFKAADPGTKAAVDKVVASLKSQNYESADLYLEKLKGLSTTPEQSGAIQSLLEALPPHPRAQP